MTQAVGRRPSAFWPTTWLVLALVAVKATYAEHSFWGGFPSPISWDFVAWVAAASQADVLFALVAGGIVAGLLGITRRRPAVLRAAWWSFIVFGCVSVVYAVVARQAFTYFGAPLTYQLLALGGDPARLRSSLEPFMTPRVAASLVGLPLGYAILSWSAAGFDARCSRAVRWRMRAGAAVILIGWLATGRLLIGSTWFAAQDRYVPASPHAWLLQSSVSAWSGARADIRAAQVRPDDLLEFTRDAAGSRAGAGGDTARAVQSSRHDKTPRNVILIVLESVGARYLSLYGSHADTTPRLLAEQRNAMVFDHYYAPVAWTAYSLYAIVSSRRPPLEAYNEQSFRTSTMSGVSLASALRASGYRTAFMAAGDPDWASPGFLEANGFEEVVRAQALPGAVPVSSWGTRDGTLFDGMRDWIGRHDTEPFFLMAWTDQTHNPYALAPGQSPMAEVPERTAQRDALGRYLSLIREDDTQIGQLLEYLRASGRADDTLVVVTGDHGEAFGAPHGGAGHGFTVYDEEVRVPLVLWNPSLFQGGGRSPSVGTHIDLAPTVLDLVGAKAPASWDGLSLFDPSRSPRAYLFAAAWGQYLLGVRDENWKYVYDGLGGREELYDLATDTEEQHDVAAAHPERTGRLRQRLAAWLTADAQRAASSRR